MPLRPFVLTLLVLVYMATLASEAQRPAGGPGAVDLAKDPFKGVTADGAVQPGLFAIRSTGVSTKSVMDVAARFIAALTPEQRATTTFAVADDEWRRWNNVHRAARAGLAFKDMSDAQ